MLPALREWSSTVDAVLAGRQCLLIRKGGISEGSAGFTADHRRFVLLPTLFHQHQSTPPALPNPLVLHVVCDLLGVREVSSGADLSGFRRFHAYEIGQLQTRISYKPEKPLTLMAIRPWRLVVPLAIDPNTLPATCRSWLELDLEETASDIIPTNISDLLAVLADADRCTDSKLELSAGPLQEAHGISKH